MPLLVVPLAADEVDLLTVGELDQLRACDKVLFERADHPLLERLRTEGVEAGPFDDEPSGERDNWAVVVDPRSPRVLELARAGAHLAVGSARPPDGLSAAHGASVARRAGSSLARLALVMARLRSDDGCPWDREQTHASLSVHLLEEAHEVLEAIDRGEVGDELEEELGDVLLQVFFHARLAEQEARFDVAEVADRIAAKLIHRHPHVFADVVVSGAQEVLANWEAIKASEKKRADPFEGIPPSLPALLSAYKTQKRAAGLGFTADEETAVEAVQKLAVTLAEEDDDAALGDLLFWAVAVGRARGVEPEQALRKAILRFKDSLT